MNPDPKGALTTEANNGYIDTTTEIAQGSPPPAITVTARDLLPAEKFGYWLYWPNVSPLFFGPDPNFRPTVGTPNPHDIVVHYNDVVVAIALYNEVKQPPFVLPRYAIYDPWWYIKTHGGLTPPGPPDPFPWLQEFGAALALADAANAASPRLRAKVLEVVMEQLSIASATIKQQIAALQRK